VRTAAVAFVLSMLSAALFTPWVRELALRAGAIDRALSSRKVHGRPVPRLGGLAIAAAFYAPLLGLLVFQSGVGQMFLAERRLAIGLAVGGVAIVLLGVYDDLRGAGAGRKFAVQFAVAGLMYALGFRVEVLANPFGEAITIGWLGLPLTLLWIVGVVNAMNLIDGLDGLAGGVALVAVSATLLISVQRENALMILFCASLGGAVLGFLFYNFNPASIFMGDTGSMFLGFILATTSIQTSQKSSTTVAVLVPLTLLGVPILDTLLAVSRRAMRGRPLFRADREHIHHRLLAIGLSHRQAVLVLYGVCLLFGATALVLTVANSRQAAVTLASVAVLAFVFLRRLGYMRLQSGTVLSDQRRRSRSMRTAVRPFAERLRQAASPTEIWEAVRDLGDLFGASGVALHLGEASLSSSATPGDDGDRRQVTFSAGLGNTTPLPERASTFVPPKPLFRARFGLVGIRHDDGLIELGWDDGRTELDRDTELSIELFCDHVSSAYERLRSRHDRDSPRVLKLPTKPDA
jgi:UDP-GlcNAc:undecaprenyl-phosphate/decaprenyl-phosphate GlcNAc-1-phosphate transferase